MKYLIITASLLLGMTLGAQTKVTKKIAAKSNDFGITYTLPKTSLVVTAEVIKITTQAGPYFRYAEKFLGVKNPVAEDKTYYQLGKITIENKGIPDPENTYIVEFKPGTVAPYAYLSEEGFLCSINAEYEPKTENAPSAASSSSPTLDATNMSVFTEELLMAGSTTKQAEVAAKQIYRIRESRMNLLTGDADNMPPDGDALKLVIQQLESQEKGLTNLFTCITTSQSSFFDVSITPYENLEHEVLFRFSDLLGIVDADDLGGTPVYINLKSTEPPAAPIDPKEAEKKDKQVKGIIYNVPGRAQVEIVMNRKSLLKGEMQIVQFGRRENLVPVLFEDKKAPVKVFFYPETGAIKQIIQ